MNLPIFLLALSSGTLHAVWNFFSKKKSDELPVMLMGVWLANITLLPFSLYIIAQEGFSMGIFSFAIISALSDIAYYFCVMYSYREGDLSLMYPAARGTGVVLVAIFSRIIFHEQIAGMAVVGIALVVVGIFSFALKDGLSPSLLASSIKSLKYALLLGCTVVVYTLIDRAGVEQYNPIVYLNLTGVLSATILSPVVLKGDLRTVNGIKKFFSTEGKYAAIIGYGITGSYLIILFIYACFAEAKTSYITPIREFSVVIGAILGFIFLNEKITLNKIIGIVTILLGVIMIKIG